MKKKKNSVTLQGLRSLRGPLATALAGTGESVTDPEVLFCPLLSFTLFS